LYRSRHRERGVSHTANVSAKSSSGCFCAYQPAMCRTNCRENGTGRYPSRYGRRKGPNRSRHSCVR
jgi:hypothetical protein